MRSKMQTPDQVRGDGWSKGFTFVELLVVVTIIAVLTAVAVVSYTSTNKKARDTKRKADLQEIRSALEIKRAECGVYGPLSLYDTGVECDGDVYLAPDRVPTDPKSGNDYNYVITASIYALCTWEMENEPGYCVTNP